MENRPQAGGEIDREQMMAANAITIEDTVGVIGHSAGSADDDAAPKAWPNLNGSGPTWAELVDLPQRIRDAIHGIADTEEVQACCRHSVERRVPVEARATDEKLVGRNRVLTDKADLEGGRIDGIEALVCCIGRIECYCTRGRRK